MNIFKKSIINIAVLTILPILLFGTILTVNIQAQTTTNLNQPYKDEFLNEVIPNHNKVTENRINLIFTTWEDSPKFRQFLRDNLPNLIGWNGKYLAQNSRKNGVRLDYHFFATDPIRNYKNRFNLWFATPKERIYDTQELYKDMKNRIEIDFDALTVGGTSGKWDRPNGESSVKFGQDQGNEGYMASINLGLSLNNIESLSSTAHSLTHELGHALFRFADEYFIPSYYDNRLPEDAKLRFSEKEVVRSYINVSTNCAVNDEAGRAKWANYIDTIDPMVFEIQKDLELAGLPNNQNPEDYKIGYYPVYKCLSQINNPEIDKLGIIVPTRKSLMANRDYDTYQVWGTPHIEYIDNFFKTVIKGDGDEIPFVNNTITKEDVAKYASTTYKQKYEKIAENYGGRIDVDPTPEEWKAMSEKFMNNTDPLDIEKIQQTPGKLGYLAIRRNLLKLIRLDRTPVFAGTVPYFNIRYTSIRNEHVYYIMDLLFLIFCFLIFRLFRQFTNKHINQKK